MNTFSITKKDDAPEFEKVELTLSDDIHDCIMDRIKERWLLPVLQGERYVLPEGGTRYCFFLSSEDADFLKNVFLQAFTKHTGYNTNN